MPGILDTADPHLLPVPLLRVVLALVLPPVQLLPVRIPQPKLGAPESGRRLLTHERDIVQHNPPRPGQVLVLLPVDQQDIGLPLGAAVRRHRLWQSAEDVDGDADFLGDDRAAAEEGVDEDAAGGLAGQEDSARVGVEPGGWVLGFGFWVLGFGFVLGVAGADCALMDVP